MMALAWSLANRNAGIRIDIRIAMIAITTNSSISVNALLLIGFPFSAKALKDLDNETCSKQVFLFVSGAFCPANKIHKTPFLFPYSTAFYCS
jgi:hypothetical protein